MKFNTFKLEEVCELITDGSHSSPKAVTNGYKMLSVKDMGAFDFDYENAKQISEEDYIKLKKGNCQPIKNDVLIAKDGNSCLEYCFVFRENKSVVLLSSIAILRPNLDVINPYYLMYYLGMESTKKALRDGYLSGSAIPRVVLKDFKKFPLKIPNIDVQNRIVHLIRNINAKMENDVKSIANLEHLSQTLFKHWFIDFEFPNEQGNPYKSSGGEMMESELREIPRGWETIEFKEIMKISSGKRPKKKVNDIDEENVIPIIGASKLMGFTNEFLYDSPILVIGRVGTHGVVQKLIEPCWPSDNTLIIESELYNFAYEFLKIIDYKSLNRGSTQPLITQSDIKARKLAFPTNENLVKKFESTLTSLLEKQFLLKKEIQKLEELRDALLPKLLSGEIEMPDDLEVK
ncbi:restriction endonuclease subunit S [Bacillus wiedmannii]|uniref:restriction endonuclease subunit S n=1 Tax=Bacillus wiedmannii TaxID=1890302 RepID=UPI003CF50E7D